MDDHEMTKQIEQMAEFIRQEAKEKKREIDESAKEEADIEKSMFVEAEKKKIRQEYERKEKQVEVRKKIEYSMQLNASRLKVLQAQDDLVMAMRDAASKELLRVSSPEAYRRLIKGLIIQSLLRLKEPAVLLRCRHSDRLAVQAVLEDAKQEYSKKAQLPIPRVTLDEKVYLPPAPTHVDSHEVFCSGGVVVASQDGKIVFENTMDARLEVVFRQKLPEIRKNLFGKIFFPM